MDYLEQSQIDIIVNSAPHELEEREEAYRMQLAIKRIRSHFQALAAQGEIEKKRWKILQHLLQKRAQRYYAKQLGKKNE